MGATFKDFLPKGYSHLYVKSKKTGQKIEIDASLIRSFYVLSENEIIISFYEGKKTRTMLTPYKLQQILTVFSESDD